MNANLNESLLYHHHLHCHHKVIDDSVLMESDDKLGDIDEIHQVLSEILIEQKIISSFVNIWSITCNIWAGQSGEMGLSIIHHINPLNSSILSAY